MLVERTFVARRSLHHPCALCGERIASNDNVACSGQLRFHVQCTVIREREQINDWELEEGFHTWQEDGPFRKLKPSALWHEAQAAIAADRKAGVTACAR
jgi:hypothetical protein